MQQHLLGVLCALASAVIWGGGDFSGGLATRRAQPQQVLVVSALSGIVVLVLCALLRGEPLPSGESALWAALAGLGGTIGLGGLYRALSLGQAASVAPTAAVVSAGLPVLFGALTQGLPKGTQLGGFALALLGIWLVSRAGGETLSRRGLALALLAGAGFGSFFILIAQIQEQLVFSPLVIARSMTVACSLLMLFSSRAPLPALSTSRIALLAGVLDAGGNIFYVLAKQFTRLDVAAVLSSLYPASTVLLSTLILKERITPTQGQGTLLCLAAIVLITL